MISKELSDKIKVCSIIATLFVVYRHSFVEQAFGLNDSHVGLLLYYSTKVVSTFTEIAVPLFFIISGFFFFQRSYDDVYSYKKMITKKFQTLFIPFIFWNIMGLIVLVVSGKFEKVVSVWDFLGNFFLSLYYGPLWYVRDLMILMFFSPLYLWIFQKRNIFLLLIVLLILLCSWLPVDCRLLSIEGVLFFLLGVLLNYKLDILSLKFSPKIALLLFLVWLCIVFEFNMREHELMHKISIFLAILSFWISLDWLPSKIYMFLKNVSKYAFFIYVTHFYFVKTFKIIIAHFFEKNEIVAWGTFIFLPIACFFILIYFAQLFNKRYHKIYSLLTGNR